MNFNEISQVCDKALAEYDFGEGVIVEATSGWEHCSSSKEVTCPIFLRFDDDDPDQDTHQATFSVVIEDGKVSQVDCSFKGNIIGNYISNQ